MTKYYAPQFSVSVNGSELSADISNNVKQLKVVKSVESADDTCSLTIANPAPRMRWTHAPEADLFWIGGDILVAMGYVDDLRELMIGVITGVSATFPDSDMPTITVTGSSNLQKLNGSHQTRPFTGKTAKDIVEQIGTAAGLKVQAEDPGVSYDYKVQANQTDFQFLRSIAERVHYELLVVDDTLYFRHPKETEDKKYTFVWSPTGHYSSDQENTLPLKSFDPVANVLNQKATETETRGHDPATKQPVKGTSTSRDVKPAGSQPGADVRQKSLGPSKRVHVTTPVRSQAEADEHAKGRQGKYGEDFVRGTAHTIGVPDLKPGAAVELKGLGLFEGTYYVSTVTHTISNSGYMTDFVVQRNATNAK